MKHLILVVIFLGIFSNADATNIFPKVKDDKKQFKVMYIEDGSTKDNVQYLLSISQCLQKTQLISNFSIPQNIVDKENSRLIWEYIADNSQSSILSFDKYSFISLDWNDDEDSYETIKKHLSSHNIDLILSSGILSLRMLERISSEVTLPPVVAYGLGTYIYSEYKTPYHKRGITAQYVPSKGKEQFEFLYDIFRFKKLGVCYNKSTRYDYHNIELLESVAAKKNFEVIANSSDYKDKTYHEGLSQCIKETSNQGIDFFYLPQQKGIKLTKYFKYIHPLLLKKIPMFTHGGDEEVKRGALIVLQNIDYKIASQDIVNRIIHIMNGVDTLTLYPYLIMPNGVLVNTETARRLGFVFPDDMIGIITGKREIIDVDSYNER